VKRLGVIIAVVMVAGFITISIWKSTNINSDLKPESLSSLSAKKKTEIKRFWDVYRKATDLRQESEWEDAETFYREALTIDSHHKDALYYYGNVLFELEKYNEAVVAWRKLTEVNPLSNRAHIQLGSLYSCGAEGAPFDLNIAEQEFHRAMAINKEQTGPLLKLGEVYLLRGNISQAQIYFNTVLQSNNNSVEAYYLIGYLKWKTGEGEEALHALQKAVEFSNIKQEAGIPMGEGDTRTNGAGPMLAEGTIRKSIFATHWRALKDWPESEISIGQMKNEYQELDYRLKILIGKKGINTRQRK
jgi:tetratricopeptide (TPR) repeat protein